MAMMRKKLHKDSIAIADFEYEGREPQAKGYVLF